MNRPRLIIHAGLHKTGSSYLQSQLLHDRELLQKAGFDLAHGFCTTSGAHYDFVARLRQNEFSEALGIIINAEYDNNIISSETLTHWVMRASNAIEFAKMLRRHFDITVVLFLRRQDYLKESVYAEVASQWFRGEILEESHYYYDFSNLISRFMKVFGKQALRIGIYRDDRKMNLLDEFLILADIPLSVSRFSPIGRSRTSLHRRARLFISQLPKRDKEFVRKNRILLRQSRCIHDDGIPYIMSPYQRKEFLGRHIGSNTSIQDFIKEDDRDYMLGRDDNRENWHPAEPLRFEEVAEYIAELHKRYAEL